MSPPRRALLPPSNGVRSPVRGTPPRIDGGEMMIQTQARDRLKPRELRIIVGRHGCASYNPRCGEIGTLGIIPAKLRMEPDSSSNLRTILILKLEYAGLQGIAYRCTNQPRVVGADILASSASVGLKERPNVDSGSQAPHGLQKQIQSARRHRLCRSGVASEKRLRTGTM